MRNDGDRDGKDETISPIAGREIATNDWTNSVTETMLAPNRTLKLEPFVQTYLTPLIKEKIVLFFELSAKLTPSERTIRVRFMMPAAPRPCSALPKSSIGQVTAAAQRTLPIKIQNI
jgi:hypothetical protein